MRKKTKEAAEKAQKKAEIKPAGEAKTKKVEEEELDPSKYTDMRKNFINALRAEGKNPYPHKF